MAVFENIISVLTEFGFFAVLLPWLLIFAIFYGILLKSGVLGDNKQVNALVAFAVAFFVVATTPVVTALNNLIPAASYLIVAVLLMLLLMGFFVKDINGIVESKWVKLILAGLIVIVFLGVISYTSNIPIPGISQLVAFFLGQGGEVAVPGIPGINEETLMTFGAIALMGVVILGTMYYMTKN